MANVKPIPDGYHSVTPYLYIKGAAQAIDFYKRAFGARERMRMAGPDGTVGHAEIQIGDSVVMLADAPATAADARKGVTSSLLIYTEDVDAMWKRALDAGATEVQPLENKFYGDRMGMVRDPFGHEWSLGTHIEDVSPQEMERRMAAMPASSA
ncbi:MAG TPA: VOC family protein [Dehalococcoidia bacterium]|jgi:PhnB protein|nr:VOC family protein [Dehalococcoidia bacterium]